MNQKQHHDEMNAQPTPSQMQEFYAQVASRQITKASLDGFLRGRNDTLKEFTERLMNMKQGTIGAIPENILEIMEATIIEHDATNIITSIEETAIDDDPSYAEDCRRDSPRGLACDPKHFSSKGVHLFTIGDYELWMLSECELILFIKSVDRGESRDTGTERYNKWWRTMRSVAKRFNVSIHGAITRGEITVRE